MYVIADRHARSHDPQGLYFLFLAQGVELDERPKFIIMFIRKRHASSCLTSGVPQTEMHALTNPQGLYFVQGVQLDVPESLLKGWTCYYHAPYSNATFTGVCVCVCVCVSVCV